MNRLLIFYFPKIFKETLYFFFGAIVVSIAIHFLPIDIDVKDSAIKFFLYFVFPFIVYFNRMLYLPASLDWILLTPIKKKHILLAHGLINIIKITFTYILINIFIVIYESILLDKIQGSLFNDSVIVSRFNRFSVENLVLLIGLIEICVIFIFGILPNYVQNIQQNQNYKVKRTVKDNFKRYLFITAGLFIGVRIFSEDTGPDYYFPLFIKIALFYVFVLFIAVYSSLTSLRYYFSKMKLSAVGLMFFMLFAGSLNFYASNDILSKDLHVKNKFESLSFLGAYSRNLDLELEQELLLSDPSLKGLASHNIEYLSKMKGFRNYSKIIQNWEKLCHKRIDFTCRLAYYGQSTFRGKAAFLEMVRKTCRYDLGSCNIIFDNQEIGRAHV